MSNCLKGRGVDFELINANAKVIENGAPITFNVHRQNNTKIKNECSKCECDKEFFIFNHLNSAAINLKKCGRYTFAVNVSGETVAPATAIVIAVTDNEGNIEKIPFNGLEGTVSGTVSMYFRENFSTVRLLNVSGAALTLATFTDEIPQVILEITYEGI